MEHATDAVVTADILLNLETEIAMLRSALEAKDLELHETKVHAENYASRALQDSTKRVLLKMHMLSIHVLLAIFAQAKSLLQLLT